MASLTSACRSNDVGRALSALFKQPKIINQVEMRTGKNPLHICAEHNSVDVAKVLLEKKADINFPATGTIFNCWTALHFAYVCLLVCSDLWLIQVCAALPCTRCV